MSKLASAYLSLALLLSACGSREVLVDRPVPVEVVRVEYVQIPTDLTVERPKAPVPPDLNYGEAIALWSEDRARIDTLNGQIRAIRSLENP
jgi:hypothetical protein